MKDEYPIISKVLEDLNKVLTKAQKDTHIILDFSNVDYINSEAISLLFQIYSKAGKLTLINLQGRVEYILEISGLLKFFKSSEEE